jgi:hypothetical protein
MFGFCIATVLDSVNYNAVQTLFNTEIRWARIFCDSLSLSRLPSREKSQRLVDLQKMRTEYRYLLRCFFHF